MFSSEKQADRSYFRRKRRASFDAFVYLRNAALEGDACLVIIMYSLRATVLGLVGRLVISDST